MKNINEHHFDEVIDIFDRICTVWIERKDIEEASIFFTEDITFIGFENNIPIHGKANLINYLYQKEKFIPQNSTFTKSVISKEMINDKTILIVSEMILKKAIYFWSIRISIIFILEKDTWLIKSMHFSEAVNTKKINENKPKILRMKDTVELLDRSLPGSLISFYLEEGFPFYFVNQRMLDSLGFDNETELIKHFYGLFLNSIHPNDQHSLKKVFLNSSNTSNIECQIAFRMQKKDGSYLWFDAIAKTIQDSETKNIVNIVCTDITLQKENEEEIKHIYNNIPGAVFRCKFDSVFSIIDANDALFDFIGYSRKEFMMLGNNMSTVIYPEDLIVMRQKIESQLEEGNKIHNEVRLIRKNQEVKWISIKGELFTKRNNEEYFYCVCIDITEEKKLQERIKDIYKKELAYFVELSTVEGNIQGRINITKNVVEFYKASPDVSIGKAGDSYDYIMEQFFESIEDETEKKMIKNSVQRDKVLADYDKGRTEYRFTYLRKSNHQSLFWASTIFRNYIDPETGDIIMFFYTFDMTETKLKEQLVTQIAELDHDTTIDIDILHDHFTLIASQKTGQNILPPKGYFQEEIRKLANRFMDEKNAQIYIRNLDYEYMKRQLEQNNVYSFVIEIKDVDGSTQIKKYQLFYIDKLLQRICMARSDVTDVVRQEQQQKNNLSAALIAAEQANAAKSDFLSRMSHEIRTPMNAIIGMTTIAAQSIGDDERIADCLSKIGISSRFLLSLINDILDMTRIESGKMLLKNEKIPTEEFLTDINSICYTQAASKNIDYECIIDSALDDYYLGDAMKLQQVLINILSNAIKFTNEGGKVNFIVSQKRKTKDIAELRFIINDTGIGISQSFMDKLFEPFSQESTGITNAYGGTGLGLAISKNIIDMMDGKITVHSIKNVGSEFIVDLKLGITEESRKQYNKKINTDFSYLSTLVIDDDISVCESTLMILKDMGIKAEWIDSGYKAIEKVKHMKMKKSFYDIILIDWKMPGMDGIETAKGIREIVGPDVTIIIMTAYDWASIEHEAKIAGVNLLISKPMFRSSLVSAFTKALGNKADQKESVIPEYDFKGRKILLVEDNAINTEVATVLLEKKGFTVETADNGLRALELFSKSEPGTYDAILMDIRMPLMDGLTATINIRHLSNQDAKSIPIIAMTANAFDEDKDKSKAAGMNAHLAKPISPEQLYQTLYNLIFKDKDENYGSI